MPLTCCAGPLVCSLSADAALATTGDVAPDLFEFPYQVRMIVEQVLVDECVRNLQLRQNGHNLLASQESGLRISNAIASTIAAAGLAHLLPVSGLRQMCHSYRTRSPEWRHERPYRAVGIRNVKKSVSAEKGPAVYSCVTCKPGMRPKSRMLLVPTA
jgi:hypothetical protein